MLTTVKRVRLALLAANLYYKIERAFSQDDKDCIPTVSSNSPWQNPLKFYLTVKFGARNGCVVEALFQILTLLLPPHQVYECIDCRILVITSRGGAPANQLTSPRAK